MERNGLTGYYIIDLLMQAVENGLIGRNEARLEAVAASEVLRHDYRNRPFIVEHEKDFRVVRREVAVYDSLGDEGPQDKSLV